MILKLIAWLLAFLLSLDRHILKLLSYIERVKLIMFYNRVLAFFRRIFWSYERQAKQAGVTMGEYNFIASRFWSTEPYLIRIGSHCQITNGVKFYTHGGAGAVRKKYPDFDTFGRIVIGDYVYIGNNAMLMPGVTVGDNVLIAAGSIVTKSIPSNVVVAGNPAKFICSIEEYTERNLKYNTSTKGMSQKEKKHILLNMNEEKFITKDYIKNVR